MSTWASCEGESDPRSHVALAAVAAVVAVVAAVAAAVVVTVLAGVAPRRAEGKTPLRVRRLLTLATSAPWCVHLPEPNARGAM